MNETSLEDVLENEIHCMQAGTLSLAQDVDFDAESMSSQITDSINALQKELRKAITQLNDKEFTDS